MNTEGPLTPVEQIFAEIIAAFLRMIAGREPWIKPEPLTQTQRWLIGDRVRRYARRFAAIAVRWRAGTLRRLPRRAARDPEVPEAGSARSMKPRAEQNPLTRTRGWVGQLTGWQGRRYGGQLEDLIRNNPEMRALLEAAPQLGDVLRSLLRMFFVRDVAPGVLPPSRRRPAPHRPRRRSAQGRLAANASPLATAAEPDPAPAGGAAEPSVRGRRISHREILRRNPWLPHHPDRARERLVIPPTVPNFERK